PAGWGTRTALPHGAAVGARVLAPAGLWGAARGPHALRAPERQEAASMGGATRRVFHAGAPRAAPCSDPGGVAEVGDAAGRRRAAPLLGGGRAHWRSGAPPAPAAGGPAAAGHGVDDPASRRW